MQLSEANYIITYSSFDWLSINWDGNEKIVPVYNGSPFWYNSIVD